MDNLILLRLAERIIAVLIGGVAIYLGYRLFLNVPQSTESEGRFVLPWNIRIVLSRIGPGVFFALFGTVVVGSSFYRTIQYDGPVPARNKQELNAIASVGDAGGHFIGATPVSTEIDAREDARMLLQRDIAVLNNIPSQLDPHLTPQNRSAIEYAIPRVKLALMEAVWGDWGDRVAFKRWVESREDKVPGGLEKAAEYYRYGMKAKP